MVIIITYNEYCVKFFNVIEKPTIFIYIKTNKNLKKKHFKGLSINENTIKYFSKYTTSRKG